MSRITFTLTRNRFVLINILLSTILTILSAFSHAQEHPNTQKDYKLHKKGEQYITFGYNRSWYENSDIHFSGQGHNFTLYGVKAVDKPTPLSIEYIEPNHITVPQFNLHWGYFISDKYSISLGWDHMKYHAVENQAVDMYGYLDPSQVANPDMQKTMQQFTGTNGIKTYNNTSVIIDPINFLSYNHYNGFNYASLELERYDNLWQSKKYRTVGLTLMTGIGTGLAICRDNVNLFGNGASHFWSVDGWGIDAKVGLQINLTKHWYLQTDFKYGYVDLLNVHTTNYYTIDKAEQTIIFYENSWVLGYKF